MSGAQAKNTVGPLGVLSHCGVTFLGMPSSGCAVQGCALCRGHISCTI